MFTEDAFVEIMLNNGCNIQRKIGEWKLKGSWSGDSPFVDSDRSSDV